MELIAIAAQSANGVMGNGNKLPWPYNRQDLNWFKKITEGSPLIMGRKTFESLPGILPGRKHYVVSTALVQHEPPSVEYVLPHKVPELILQLDCKQAFLIGGAQLFSTYLIMCEAIYLRTFYADYPGDVLFPSDQLNGRKVIATEQWNDSITEIYV